MRSMVVTGGTSGASLQLHQPGVSFLLEGTFSTGQQQRRRVTTESNVVAGRYATSIVEGQRVGTVGVAVQAFQSAQLQPRMQAILAIVSEFRFSLAWQYDGLSGTWTCEAADYAFGDQSGTVDEFWLEPPSANDTTVYAQAPIVQTLYLSIPHRRLTGP